jgi:YHS domain-containing protein
MADTITCEHCGKVAPKSTAERIVAESWTHYFCSELCKIQWGEQAEIEDEEEPA